MSNYTYTADFKAKDDLPAGSAGKVIRGNDFETEFLAVQAAVNSKADSGGGDFTGDVSMSNLTVTGRLESQGVLKVSGTLDAVVDGGTY
jgi:hypothetical protein